MRRSRLSRCVQRGTLLVFVLLLALAGAQVYAQSTPQQSALQPAGPVARMQLDLFMLTVYIAIGIFTLVVGLLLIAIVRFRSRPGRPEPKQVTGNNTLEVVWTIVPVILVAIIAVPTVRGLFFVDTPPEGESITVNVTAHQWWWEFEYPDYGIVTANEMRIPTGKVVKLNLTSSDVIHSFWVPNLAGKMDTNPGRWNSMWLQADTPGVYYGQCAEFCGVAHANMRFRVIAETPEEFDAWVARWEEAVVEPVVHAETPDLVARGAEAFMDRACFACHAIAGTDAKGVVGPNLTLFGTRTSLAAGMLDNTPENLAAWIRDPQAIKPGNQMPRLNVPEEDIQAIVAYLHSLR